jgi:hypothetical protein
MFYLSLAEIQNNACPIPSHTYHFHEAHVQIRTFPHAEIQTNGLAHTCHFHEAHVQIRTFPHAEIQTNGLGHTCHFHEGHAHILTISLQKYKTKLILAARVPIISVEPDESNSIAVDISIQPSLNFGRYTVVALQVNVALCRENYMMK